MITELSNQRTNHIYREQEIQLIKKQLFRNFTAYLCKTNTFAVLTEDLLDHW
jgi:hypothetical protein